MKKLFIVSYPKMGIITVVILIILPVFAKKFILNLFSINGIISYYEVLSAIISGIAVIVAFLSLQQQQDEIKEQNSRLAFSVRMEALAKILDLRKMMAQANPELRENREWIRETADYLKALEHSVKKMIDETGPNS